MKITKIKIENFRGYKEEQVIEIDNLSVFVGKNDVGKSTILEALDIFFNEKKAISPPDKDDLNKSAPTDAQISISVCFSEFPDKIDIDAGNETNLKDEFLLNPDGELEIKKNIASGKVPDTFLVANHPSNELAKDLLEKKISDLQKIVKEQDWDCIDKTKKAELRKTIRDNCDDMMLSLQDIPVKKEDAQAVWNKLKEYMPIYALFQADRSNKDQDSEVQDPMKLAVREVLEDSSLQEKFQEIAKVVNEKTEEIANQTLKKLKDMNPEIANELKPVMPSYESLNWKDVFKKIDISSDDGIPLNKRGSGIRRLILLNFFRAEADRRKEERNVKDVIYAIEEPETSQHPDHQVILIEAFKNLAETESTQILLTTHSPAIVKMMDRNNLDNLNVIRKNEHNILKIEKAQELQLPYRSFNEISYIAFDYVSEEYHNELYGVLQEKAILIDQKYYKQKDFEDYLLGLGVLKDKRYKHSKADGSHDEYDSTLPTYIRNMIHHPENTLNPDFSDVELKQSIITMRQLI